MKRFERIKGFVLGVVMTLIITYSFVPALADSIDVIFNNINIRINGQQVASQGDSYRLDNGDEVPFSILYKGTTYLPLRKIGELYDKEILWNGETSTASVSDVIKESSDDASRDLSNDSSSSDSQQPPEQDENPTPPQNEILPVSPSPSPSASKDNSAKIKELETSLAQARNTQSQLEAKLTKAQANLSSAQSALAKAESQKTVQIYKEGQGFVWVADPNAVASAQMKVNNYQTEVDSINNQLATIRNTIAALEAEIASLR